MRIVFVLHAPSDPKTAVYAHTADRAELLRARGHSVEILTHDSEPDLRRTAPRWWPFAFPLRAARRLSAVPPDLAIFHSYAGWAFAILRAIRPRLRRVRTIVQFHGVETLHYRAMRAAERRRGRDFPLRHRLLQSAAFPWLLRLSCRSARRVFCLNRGEREFLAARGWAKAERIEIVPNPAPADLLALAPDRSRPPRRLLFVGQWLEGKGIHDLAVAFSELAAERGDLTLALVGTRTAAASVRDAFPAAVRDRVEVEPHADREAIRAAFAAADLFLFPSLSEGSSLALLEAMAAALPIVTTPVGAAPDLLTEGESALFVPVADPAALAAAVRRLLGDPDLRARLGDNARKVAATQEDPALRDDYVRRVESAGAEA